MTADHNFDEFLLETCRDLGVPGAQVAIFDGVGVSAFAVGCRNVGLDLPVSDDTLFQIGSTTKLYNAILILKLCEQGKLDLDSPVANYLPKRSSLGEISVDVTLRQLLSMTSGLDNGPYQDFGRGDDAVGKYVANLNGIAPIFPPGSAFGYSNAGTIVAGHIAASALGTTWEDAVRKEVWLPLGLKHTALLPEELLFHPLALGYRPAPNRDAPPLLLETWSLPRSMGPAGGLTCSNAEDLISLARLFLSEGLTPNGERLLATATVELMQTPQIRLATRLFADEWCIGPFRNRWGGKYVFGHYGTNLSGSSSLLWCPQTGTAVATLVNAPAQGYPLAEKVLGRLLPALGIQRPVSAGAPDPPAAGSALAPYIGWFRAHGMSLSFREHHRKLLMTSQIDQAPEMNVVDCELLTLGEGRFLPADPRSSGNRNWDIAFWGSDAAGKSTHVLQGIFPLKRDDDHCH